MKPVELKGNVAQEWRVTGTPSGPYPPYFCIFSQHTYDDPEAAARAFVSAINQAHRIPWEDGPHLSSRWVTRSESEWVGEA